jgi:ABC-type multidrug transport system fused ATPase/permease subunit
VINFFRIVIQGSEIICLDEATSNMFAKGKTLICITHRLENISKFDKIVVMEKGEIKECGSYSELVNTPNGFFHHLLQH